MIMKSSAVQILLTVTAILTIYSSFSVHAYIKTILINVLIALRLSCMLILSYVKYQQM